MAAEHAKWQREGERLWTLKTPDGTMHGHLFRDEPDGGGGPWNWFADAISREELHQWIQTESSPYGWRFSFVEAKWHVENWVYANRPGVLLDEPTPPTVADPNKPKTLATMRRELRSVVRSRS